MLAAADATALFFFAQPRVNLGDGNWVSLCSAMEIFTPTPALPFQKAVSPLRCPGNLACRFIN
jgi:hypothetical protein